MVERPPVVSLKDLRAAYISLKSGKEYDGLSSLIEQMNDEYEYWSSVKYKKSDITKLLRMGALSEISFNKVKKGYIKGEKFDDIVSILP